MDGKNWQKAIMFGVCGLVCGYFAMRFAIKSDPVLFGESRTVDLKKVHIPEMPKPTIPKPILAPAGSNPEPRQPSPEALRRELGQDRKIQADREERERRTQEMKAEHERRVQAMREDHQRRVQAMKEEQEKRTAEREAMKKEQEKQIAEREADPETEPETEPEAAEAGKENDRKYLATLSMEVLEEMKITRQAELDRAKEALRRRDITAEERKAASKAFSDGVKAYQAVVFAISDKRRAASGR